MCQTPGHCPEKYRSNQLLNTCPEVSSNPEDVDSLVQVYLIRVGAKLCRIVALQELNLTPLGCAEPTNSNHTMKAPHRNLQDLLFKGS